MKRKILIIVENAPAPFDPRVWKEASSLHVQGYEVCVLCPRDKGYERGYELLDGVHIYRHPMPTEGNGLFGYLLEYGCALFWQFFYAWWIYLRRGFQVIQGCNPPDNIFLIALPFKLLGVRYIFDHHDANPELYLSKYDKPGRLYKTQVWLEKQTYRFSDVVMATNQSYRDLAITRGAKAPEDVFVVRNGPDLDTFKAVLPILDLKYGKRYLVGYVGTMSIQEGLDILLDVALYTKNMGRRDIHFTCVGGGPGLAGLLKMVQDKNLGDMVNFTGRVPDKQLLETLSTADVCVNPDKPCQMNDISTMIKIMEYMALGKPIVQFDLKEGRFSAQGASLYADAKNQVADFAAKILWLLDRPDVRKTMGEAALKRVAEELAWKYSVPNLLSAYDRVYDKRAKGRPPVRLEAPVQRREMPEAAKIRGDLKLSVGPDPASRVLSNYYRCPVNFLKFAATDRSDAPPGYFRLGADTICYGSISSGKTANAPEAEVYDALEHIKRAPGGIELPFDPEEAVENLQRERYTAHSRQQGGARNEILRKAYYGIRPILGVAVRRHLQRLHLRGWHEIAFPAWPVDTTLERFHQRLLALSLRAQNLEKIPFIWFWPDGFSSCAILTHDIEDQSGKEFCHKLMDIDESFGFRSSFQVIPENRYPVSKKFLDSITSRGFEVNVHDLKHDGRLYAEYAEFRCRAQRINNYVRDFEAQGFRSGILYRNADWYDAFEFSYDMSIPNVAHLDPQRGGCCTVMPYFIGKIVELPVTCTQDYTLFQILGDYTLDLWKKQISLVREQHGLISFIVHPDYLGEQRAQDTYRALLGHLAELRAEHNVWAALPREVAAWWNERSKLELIQSNGEWRVAGPGSERARVAYASVAGSELAYSLHPREAGLQSA